MKKYFALILFLYGIEKNVTSQNIPPTLISKSTMSRLYMGVFKSITQKIYEQSNLGFITAYKDEEFTKKVITDNFKYIGSHKEKRKAEIWKDGKLIQGDTLIPMMSSWDWLWGFKKLTTGNFAVYYQKPMDIAFGTGELLAYYFSADLKKILTEFEWKILSDFTKIPNQIVNKNNYFDRYWNIYKGMKNELWSEAAADKIQPYINFNFLEKYKTGEVKEVYKKSMVVDVKPDSLHPEYDYKRTDYFPFISDSLKGFAFTLKVNNDFETGTNSISVYGISPLYDASQSGTEEGFMESMFWMKYNEYTKYLKVDEINLINEIVYMCITEKLNIDIY